jgi:hypothetical protein
MSLIETRGEKKAMSQSAKVPKKNNWFKDVLRWKYSSENSMKMMSTETVKLIPRRRHWCSPACPAFLC